MFTRWFEEHLRHRRVEGPICTLPCCWPPVRRPKVRVWKDRSVERWLSLRLPLWRWEITERPGGRVLAHGSAFDHPHALSNGLYALDHLTETVVRNAR